MHKFKKYNFELVKAAGGRGRLIMVNGYGVNFMFSIM